MTKHTPEPWKCDGLEISTLGRGIIANCPTPQNGGVFECSANARLIAAAPELLETAQDLLDAAADPNKTVQNTRWSNAVKRANAAIAKATGDA